MTADALSPELAQDSIALVRKWLTEAQGFPVDSSAVMLAGVLKDPNGLAFTVGFVDGVVRPEDLSVAARNLKELAPKVPAFLPWYMRAAVRVGGLVAPILPGVVIPISRKVLRNMVGHLIVDATDAKLGGAIAKLRKPGVRLNVNLLGEAVLGEREAARRLEGTRALLARDDVDYVSIKVSSTVAPHSAWAFEQDVEHVVDRLLPLFHLAAESASPKFINLDMEEFKDLDITIAVFTRILDRPELLNLEAGIVLQAYLPDALAAMIQLQEWSTARRARGGAGIKVRVVKGANLPMERVEAALHDWPLATWHTKQDSDTNYKRVINYALHPDRIGNVRIGVAGHNLFDVAYAWLLAGKRGVQSGIEFEMLLGMAQGQAEAVKKDVGGLLLYTPVVHPAEFDVAIAYLIRRLEEGASQDNFMSAVFELSANEALFEREQTRFLNSLAELDDTVPASHRVQDRTKPAKPMPTDRFENAADTDPAIAANRAWGDGILSRIATSQLGNDTVATHTVNSEAELEAVFATATGSGASWRTRSPEERAEILHRAGEVLEARRAELMEVAASETGKTLDQSDPEVTEAIDFAHYYAEQAKKLGRISGAEFVPAGLTVVTPPWNFPVAIPAGSTLAALAAGSPVIIKPAAQARRCGAVMVEALWEAGVPRDALQLVNMGDRALGSKLVSDPRVDRVILTGGYETAELFRSLRHDLPLLAETSGKNAIIVTPSADLDLAAKDVIYSAFGHAGQKCSAASLVVLVGSVATSQRFRNQLIDGVSSLKVGYPQDATTQMGPIIEPAKGKLLSALTSVGKGEKWLVEPTQLDETGKLWSPGVRDGVKAGSEYHLTEYFGPVLGIMTARTLEEAIALVNAIDYGLTSGIHSLDADEVGLWLDTIQAGNLYVNRGTTGAIVQRQPFGGWKKSAVGAGTKAGGPNYLFGLGNWEIAATADIGQAPISKHVLTLLDAIERSETLNGGELAWVRQAASLDQFSWSTEFGQAIDVSQLGVERNVFRYRSVPTQIRLMEAGNPVELFRVVLAAMRAESNFTISVPANLGERYLWALQATGIRVDQRSDGSWLSSLNELDLTNARIRLIGGSAAQVTAATNGRPDVAVYAGPVLLAGRIEMLPFLREQAVSITAHRFGTPNHLSDALI
ncbi:MAG: bifunctional proline dehydrogenase/L-glutamate gamma-semialdehyde dehydrogenase [Aurantimicrobium sp.]|uniref:bifunctional proline dehydrogenase/L-glutamate gamma-semialdehyde dehydrogenase n=1 Tax=Aurantimicrobium sp. TaxID=1930784 RepID=UPI002FC9F477